MRAVLVAFRYGTVQQAELLIGCSTESYSSNMKQTPSDSNEEVDVDTVLSSDIYGSNLKIVSVLLFKLIKLVCV